MDTQTNSTANEKTLAVQHLEGSTPGIVFCGGFRSSMQGNKARFLASLCESEGWACTLFDYQGHGASSGEFSQCGIGHWKHNTLDVIEQYTQGPQLLVGSSMGLWMALLAAIERPEKVAGILGIAGAPDFTEELIWKRLDKTLRQQLEDGMTWAMPTEYDDGEPYPITYQLINSGREHLLTHKTLPVSCPIRLLHGTADVDVPWQLSQRVLEGVSGDNATLTLIRHGDHRLSEPVHLAEIENQLRQLRNAVTSNQTN